MAEAIPDSDPRAELLELLEQKDAQVRSLEEQFDALRKVIENAAFELRIHGRLTDHAAGHVLLETADSFPAKEPNS